MRPAEVPLLLGAFGFGSIVGSFANVCIHRIPRELSIVSPGSACPACRAPVRWFDNVPILSYALLNGRCRACRAPISLRYPAVEALTGLLFALVFWRHLSDPRGTTLAATAVYLGLAAALVIVTFIDLDFRVIHDGLTLGGLALAFPLSWLVPSLHLRPWPAWPARPVDSPLEALGSAALGAAAGAGSVYLMHLLGWLYLFAKSRVLRSRALPCRALVSLLGRIPFLRLLFLEGPSDPEAPTVGGGDLKMMAAVGALLGWQAAVLVLFFLAPVVGSLVGFVLLLLTRDHYIAYGPFLAAGTLAAVLFRREILDFLAYALAFRPGLGY